MHKALIDPPDDSLWLPHHDPLVSDHIEAVTARGLSILAAIQTGVESLLGLEMRKADGWARWTPEQLSAVLDYLHGKDPNEYSLDDWLKAVDWIVHNYLPDDIIRSEAEYMAVRAVFAGNIQSNMERTGASLTEASALVAVAPTSRLIAGSVAKLSALETAVVDFSIARAAEHIADIGESTRHRLRSIIIDHEEARATGRPEATLWNLQSRMQDEFAILNRDWRRVALSEVARDANEGFLSTLEPGTRVRRIEAYNACPFCKKIDGMVFTVVSPDKPDKDGWEEVWVGKTNIGRSASPRKRVGDQLVERLDAERYWPAAGIMHPNCRGTWDKLPGATPGVDPDFLAWMDTELANHRADVLRRGEQAAEKKAAQHG